MSTPQLFVKMGIDQWNGTVGRFDKILNSLSDEQLMQEAAPGRNRGVYLLGHLAAVNDAMLPLLGFQDRQHPELDEIFLTSPDKTKELPDTAKLRAYWAESNQLLQEHFAKTSPEEWFGRHMSVSEEDFAKEPHRNKLNVLIGRAVHLAGHYGQMLYLVGKNE